MKPNDGKAWTRDELILAKKMSHGIRKLIFQVIRRFLNPSSYSAMENRT
jgi:hypothetical protein